MTDSGPLLVETRMLLGSTWDSLTAADRSYTAPDEVFVIVLVVLLVLALLPVAVALDLFRSLRTRAASYAE